MRLARLPLCLVGTLFLLAAPLAADEKLPSDERIKTGTLANGVKWLYRQHDNPPGKMFLVIHVRTGSLNETDEQRGLAHFIEHMAFNGSENFPPGKLVPYFESIGMEFGDDLNAFTSFDQTAYMLFLPDASTEQMDKALMVLSDQAFRLSLIPEEIDKERGVILEEARAGKSAEQRIQDQLFEKLFTGMRLGQRLPIGKEPIIEKAPPAQLEGYYHTWYRPDRVTLMMVGDAPVDGFVPLIEKWFGQVKAQGEAKPAQGPELKPFTAERALVLSDPEYAQCNIDVYNLGPARPPTLTLEQARVDLLDDIGQWIMGRRFSDHIKRGEVAYREASVSIQDLFQGGLFIDGSATGEPKDWEKILDQLVQEVNRAREYGFLPGEFELCKKELLSTAEDAARKDSTRNARSFLFEMLGRTNQREPIMSADQKLDVRKKLLPTIKLDEVSAAFATHFKPGTFAFVVTMPKKDDVKLPTEDEVLAAAKAAMARKTEAPQDAKSVSDLLEKEPTPGHMVEPVKDDDLAITNGWLENGVRVHYRFMDYKKDLALISITLAGGQIEETAENSGVTQVASLILSQPATKRVSSTDIEDMMTGKNIQVAGGGMDDTFGITINGSPKDLEFGLKLVHALLTDGKLEQSAFDNWKQQSLQRYEMATKMPQFVAFDTWLKTITSNDPRRPVLLTPKQIEEQSAEKAQAWFDRLCRTAPIELSVVGEIKLEEVQPLIEKYLGSLPKRPREATGLDKLRTFQREAGPLEKHATVDTITPQAVVIAGFMACNAQDIADVRALNLAANILDSRLIKRIREDLSLVYGINAQNHPEAAYKDAGFFFSAAPCAPEKAEQVVKEVETIFAAFVADGPTAEELENAKKQILNHLDTQLKEPTFWSDALEALDLHKLKLADFKDIPKAYEALTAQQVQEVFKKYDVPKRVFRIYATPTKAAESQSADKPEAAPAPKQ
jgi:zinc protease